MPTLRRVVVVLAALAVGMPGAAVAQTGTVPDDGAGGVSSKPPVALGGDGDPKAPATAAPATPAGSSGVQAGDALPNTGSDPRLLLLVGATLTLLGVGLRLRTADAELY